MRRAGILLLAACAVLAAGSAAGSLALASQPAGHKLAQRMQAADTPTPSHFAYFPMVFRSWSPEPTWVTVVEEGFESSPGDLWKFYDAKQPQQGLYYWAPRDCRHATDDPEDKSSAWAFGGGTLGQRLPCLSGYPPNVDSRMEYGPFSLEDATDAYWRFTLWLDRGDAYITDDFCWSAWSSNAEPWTPETWKECLTFDTASWYERTIDLSDPLINVLGESEVWIGFRFTSLGAGSQAEGAYVDNAEVRKCVGGVCETAASAGVEPPAAQMRKVQAVVIRPDRRLPAEQQLPK